MRAPDIAERDLSPLSVLIVDDNPNMRRLIVALLRTLRITQVREAASGAEALALLAGAPADLAIADLAIRPVGGIDFVRRLRSDPASPAPDLPVILLTGHSEEASVRRAREAGVDDIVVKPVSAGALYDRIVHTVLGERRFVATDGYTGPDRRLRARRFDGPDRRRGTA